MPQCFSSFFLSTERATAPERAALCADDVQGHVDPAFPRSDVHQGHLRCQASQKNGDSFKFNVSFL